MATNTIDLKDWNRAALCITIQRRTMTMGLNPTKYLFHVCKVYYLILKKLAIKMQNLDVAKIKEYELQIS